MEDRRIVITKKRRRRPLVLDSDDHIHPSQISLNTHGNGAGLIHAHDGSEKSLKLFTESKSPPYDHQPTSYEPLADVLTVNAFLDRVAPPNSATNSPSPLRLQKRQRRYGRRAKAISVYALPTTTTSSKGYHPNEYNRDHTDSDDCEMNARRYEHSESISASTPSFSSSICGNSDRRDYAGDCQTSPSPSMRSSKPKSLPFTTRITNAAVLAHVDRASFTHTAEGNYDPFNLDRAQVAASSLHLVQFAPGLPQAASKLEKLTKFVDPRRTPFIKSTFTIKDNAAFNTTPTKLPCTPLSKLALSRSYARWNRDDNVIAPRPRFLQDKHINTQSTHNCKLSKNLANAGIGLVECPPIQFVPYDMRSPSMANMTSRSKRPRNSNQLKSLSQILSKQISPSTPPVPPPRLNLPVPLPKRSIHDKSLWEVDPFLFTPGSSRTVRKEAELPLCANTNTPPSTESIYATEADQQIHAHVKPDGNTTGSGVNASGMAIQIHNEANHGRISGRAYEKRVPVGRKCPNTQPQPHSIGPNSVDSKPSSPMNAHRRDRVYGEFGKTACMRSEHVVSDPTQDRTVHACIRALKHSMTGAITHNKADVISRADIETTTNDAVKEVASDSEDDSKRLQNTAVSSPTPSVPVTLAGSDLFGVLGQIRDADLGVGTESRQTLDSRPLTDRRSSHQLLSVVDPAVRDTITSTDTTRSDTITTSKPSKSDAQGRGTNQLTAKSFYVEKSNLGAEVNSIHGLKRYLDELIMLDRGTGEKNRRDSTSAGVSVEARTKRAKPIASGSLRSRGITTRNVGGFERSSDGIGQFSDERWVCPSPGDGSQGNGKLLMSPCEVGDKSKSVGVVLVAGTPPEDEPPSSSGGWRL